MVGRGGGPMKNSTPNEAHCQELDLYFLCELVWLARHRFRRKREHSPAGRNGLSTTVLFRRLDLPRDGA